MTEPHQGREQGRLVGRRLRALSGRLATPPRAVPLLFLLGFAVPAAVGALRGFPLAEAHDEFSRLLAADTFVHGRLTNPSPAFPEHFLSPHILVRPTYMSKYFPGDALFLAAGHRLFGHPAFGVWLGCAVAAVALWWMLVRFTGFRWALAGTLLMILTVGGDSYWSQSYWGAMVPFAGGALVLAGLGPPPRDSRTRTLTAWGFGIGAALMMTTRPFEGVLVSGAVVLLVGLERLRAREPTLTARELLGVAAPIVAALALQVSLDRAVTGSWSRLPYAEHQRRYAPVPSFGSATRDLPDATDPLNPRVAAFEQQYTREVFEKADLWWRVRETWRSGALLLLTLAGGSVLTGVLLFLPVAALAPWLANRRRPMRVVLVALWFVVARLVTWNHGHAHYLAPLAPAVYLLAVEALRILRTGRAPRAGGRRRGEGRYLALGVALSAALSLGGQAQTLGRPGPGQIPPRQRSQLIAALLERSGDDLVFVEYGADYPVHAEWVYNGAALETQDVILAHDLGPEANARLRLHHCGRRAWRLTLSMLRGPEVRGLPPCDVPDRAEPAAPR